MHEVLEILKISIPAIVVGGTVYLVISRYLSRQDKMMLYQLKLENRKILTPTRFQAYERCILLLERISPGNLVMRLNQPGLTVRQLHGELLKNIRNEFDHNVTQQVYISAQAWEAIKSAKEESIKMVNFAASKCDDQAAGVELSKLLLEMTMKVELLPTQAAINIVKEEARQLY
jgi:hypothetical protein